MKRLFLIATLAVLAIGGFAQTGSKSAVLKAGYQTELERLGVGVQARYGITDNIRVAPDAVFFLPKNKVMGLDLGLDAHYVFNINEKVSLYPLAGLSMANNRTSSDTYTIEIGGFKQEIKEASSSSTEFGINLGAGLDYSLSENSFFNAEFKYTLNDFDYALFSIGYGVKF